MNNKLLVFLKGMLMGAADIVPGISGGTIALIVGIYEDFIDSIKAFNLTLVRTAFLVVFKHSQEHKDAFFQAVREIKPGFIIPLGLGIITSILAFSKIIPSVMMHYPIPTYSLFIGLIFASISVPYKLIDNKKNILVPLLLIAGTGLAFYISGLTPSDNTSTDINPLFIYIAGFIAISAMMLPGISGSYILLVMGVYGAVLTILHTILTSPLLLVSSREGLLIILFITGILSGFIIFSRVLSWLLKHKKDVTLAVLTGLMIGGLRKPVSEVLSALQTQEVSLLANGLLIIVPFTVGFVVVVLLDRVKK